MRHTTILVAVLAFNDCPSFTGPEEEERRIQVQGTVIAADDGSLIAGASVQVSEGPFGYLISDVFLTNNQGDYSLSFIKTGACDEGKFFIAASAQGFQLGEFGGLLVGPDDLRVRCTDELQTIDFQLERETTASTIWMRR